MLTTVEIEHLANLAKLELSEQEKERYAKELSGILEFVGQLQELDTTGVEPTAHVTGLMGGERSDVVKECNPKTRARLLHAVPRKAGDLVEVPAVFGENRN